MKNTSQILFLSLLVIVIIYPIKVIAEPLKAEINYKLVEQTRYDVPLPGFKEHWIRIAKFSGTIKGGGIFDGAKSVESGLHDIYPDIIGKGEPIYHTITLKNGDMVYMRGDRTMVVTKDKAGKSITNYTGSWFLIGGTGKANGILGRGTFNVKTVSPQEIILEVDGEYTLAKK